MASPEEHYNQLLAEHYTWMFGDYSAAVAESQRFLNDHLHPAPGEIAMDLGCGSGFQSLALSNMGYKVLAIDLNAALLEELESHKGGRDIQTHQADLQDFARYCTEPGPAVVVCMGDTLTHLPSWEHVAGLFRDIRRALAPGGRFIVTYRDMSQEVQGLDRFIPVRSDENKIMTAFLEYETNQVIVHDLIYIKSGSEWTFHKSCYPKLRLPRAQVRQSLISLGFQVEYDGFFGGLTALIASLPCLP